MLAVALFPVLLFLPATPLKYCTTTSTLFQSFWTSPSARSLTDQQRYQQISDCDFWWVPVTNDYNGFLSVLSFWNMRNVDSGIQHPVLKHKQTIDVISNLQNHVSISLVQHVSTTHLEESPQKALTLFIGIQETEVPSDHTSEQCPKMPTPSPLGGNFKRWLVVQRTAFIVYNAIQIHPNVIIWYYGQQVEWPKHLWAHWRAFARRRSRPGSMGRRLAMCTWDRLHRVQMQIQ